MARILIVDDEPRVRRILGHLLKRSGYACSYACDAAGAERHLEEQPCELMLCDVNMPGESGLELVRRLHRTRPDLAMVMVTAVDDPSVAELALASGAYGYLLKPLERNTVLITVANALRRRKLEIEQRAHRRELVRTVEERTRALRLSREETIHRLSRAAEFRDNETAEHNQRMSHYCKLIAARLGMEDARCEQIRLASVMHDVGKIGISDQILLKPGRLTPTEFEHIKSHPEIGHRILRDSSSPLLQLASTIALLHHERMDGAGYPAGLSGAAIPLEGRIVAVADVFDALTSKRCYRDALPVGQAIELLRQGSGTHFDPEIVQCFLGAMDDVLLIMERHADRESQRSCPRAGGSD